MNAGSAFRQRAFYDDVRVPELGREKRMTYWSEYIVRQGILMSPVVI